jgi:integrase
VTPIRWKSGISGSGLCRSTSGLAAGENVKVVQERLGHASAKMTLDVYAKAVPSLRREAADRMDRILSADGDT